MRNNKKHRSMKKYKRRWGWRICKISSESHTALIALAHRHGKTAKKYLDDLIQREAKAELKKEPA